VASACSEPGFHSVGATPFLSEFAVDRRDEGAAICLTLTGQGISANPDRKLDLDRFAPRRVHPGNLLGWMSFRRKIRLDGLVHDHDKRDHIRQRNVRRRANTIDLVLLQACVAQCNFLLVVNPVLVVGTAGKYRESIVGTGDCFWRGNPESLRPREYESAGRDGGCRL
jgi:hypothetical protein